MTDKITDYDTRLNELLPAQFKGQPNFTGLINAIASIIQDFENEAFRFFDELSLSSATGDQLDGLGEILGEPRNGRSDADYRAFLYVRQTINTSSGEPETLISVLAALTNSTTVQLLEPGEAYIEMFFDGTTIPDDLLANMQLIKPAGVSLSALVSASETPFVFDGDSGGLGLSSIDVPTYGGEFSGVIT